MSSIVSNIQKTSFQRCVFAGKLNSPVIGNFKNNMIRFPGVREVTKATDDASSKQIKKYTKK